MEGDERAVAVFFGKLGTRVKQQSVGRHVAGIGGGGVDVFARTFLFTIAAVLGHHHFLLLVLIVIDVGPARIRSFFQLIHGLGGQHRRLLFGVHIGKERVELVAAMLHDEQRVGLAVPIHAHHVADSGGVVDAVFQNLVGLGSFELPDAAHGVEHGAGHHTRRTFGTILHLASVGRRPDADVNVTAFVQHQRLGGVCSLVCETFDNALRLLGVHYLLVSVQLVAEDLAIG